MNILPKEWLPNGIGELVGPANGVGLRIEKIAKVYKARNASGLFLLHGPPGTGKSSLARLVLDMFGVQPLNRYNDNKGQKSKGGADFGVDDVTAFHRFISQNSLIPGYRGLRIDEIDKMSKPAQMAMLKLADDIAEGKTQPSVIVITSNQKLDELEARFHSRFQPFEVAAPSATDALGIVGKFLGPDMAKSLLKQAVGGAMGKPVDMRAVLNDTTTIAIEHDLLTLA